MTPKVFVALSTFGEYGDEPVDMLRQSGLEFATNPLGRRLTRDEVIAYLAGYDGVIAGVEPYDAVVLAQLPALRCISRAGVGIDNIAQADARQRGIEIRNTPDVVIRPVAELAVAMIFDLLKKLTKHTAALRAGRWDKFAGSMLIGRRIGIVGLGRIGRATAHLLTRLDAEVLGFDPRPDEAWARETGVTLVSREELFARSDVVSLHLSHDAANPFVLGAPELQRMQKGSCLVNLARGGMVDEDALYAALASGHLAGAALDVYSKEPYSGKLLELDSVVLTPHVATLTNESRLAMEVEATRNLLDFFTNNDLASRPGA